MPLIQNVISELKFYGASVQKYSSSGGLNLESSRVDFTLIEDVINGDRFTRPLPGTYTVFQHEGFKFEGICDQYTEQRGMDGYPVFQISINDPKEILSGVPVIIGGFRGNLAGIPNVINAFGYWENFLGFGGSNVNESGMIWEAPFDILKLNPDYGGLHITHADVIGMKPAIEAITNGDFGNYGGPIIFGGRHYPVDLGGLPKPPSLYRIGGTSVTLLDAVTQLCQDAGCDFYCFIKDGIIQFKTVSRLHQPEIGTISNYVQGLKTANNKIFGLELRNEVTNAVVVGGDINYLVQEENPLGSDSIWPFWGLDDKNTVIVGTGLPEEHHTFNLNCSPISDIIGDVIYPCDLAELRCALMDYDSWAAYVIGFYPDKAGVINLVGCVDNDLYNNVTDLFGQIIFQRDLNDFSNNTAVQMGLMNESDYWSRRAQRVYDFVSSYASDYFGKRFLVRVPFQIYWQFEPETTHIIASDEPTEYGYVQEDLALTGPLGIDFIGEEIFLGNDGRYQCFVRFSNYSSIDLTRLAPDIAVVNNHGLFIKATVDTSFGVLYPPGSIYPYVVVELAVPAYEGAATPLGDTADIANILNITEEQLLYNIGLRHGSFPLRIHPSPHRPDAIALPMKSNRDTYGPWINNNGIAGKTYFEKDESLVPWNYGSFDLLNQVAHAKIVNIATGMQTAEQADFTEVGAPSLSLGDLIIEGGPNVTNIRVEIGTNGLTTQYTMRTYTPTKLAYAKSYIDRFKRIGLAQLEARRNLRQLVLRQRQQSQTYQNAQIGFMQNTSRAVRQGTPHDVLVGSVSKSERFGFRTQVSSQTVQEVVGTVRADKLPFYKSSGAMSLEGLLRPFSTSPYSGGYVDNKTGLPHYQLPNETLFASSAITAFDLDTFGEKNDIDIMIWGDSYPAPNLDNPDWRLDRKSLNGLHTKKGSPDYSNARPLALKGPLTIHGFGCEITGKPIPNSAEYSGGMNPSGFYDSCSSSGYYKWDNPVNKWNGIDGGNGGFISGHREKPELWPVGPVDLAWDVWRGVWAPRGIMFGTITRNMNGSSGTMKIDGFNDTLEFKDWFGNGGFASGKKVSCTYWPYTNEWRLLAIGC